MKRDKIIFWLATGFLILMEGIMPLGTVLFAPEYVNLGTKPLGYPDTLPTRSPIARHWEYLQLP